MSNSNDTHRALRERLVLDSNRLDVAALARETPTEDLYAFIKEHITSKDSSLKFKRTHIVETLMLRYFVKHKLSHLVVAYLQTLIEGDTVLRLYKDNDTFQAFLAYYKSTHYGASPSAMAVYRDLPDIQQEDPSIDERVYLKKIPKKRRRIVKVRKAPVKVPAEEDASSELSDEKHSTNHD